MSFFKGTNFSFVSRMFKNEHDNNIIMKVMVDDRGVTVSASGPESWVEHTWTPLESFELMKMLSDPRIMREIEEKYTQDKELITSK